jgi:mitogen-activated protein kinase 1/3
VKHIVADKLENMKSTRTKKIRSLSNHVSSRWYRAPEICLVEKQYDFASDIWSVGCTFYELLQCLQGNSKTEQRVMLPGSSCFPLSPNEAGRGEANYQPIAKQDQIKLMVRMLGKKTDEDLSFITEESVLSHVKMLDKGGPGVDLEEVFPTVSKPVIALLEKMIEFNPYFRHSAAELLKAKVFDKIRKPSLEKSAP